MKKNSLSALSADVVMGIVNTQSASPPTPIEHFMQISYGSYISQKSMIHNTLRETSRTYQIP